MTDKEFYQKVFIAAIRAGCSSDTADVRAYEALTCLRAAIRMGKIDGQTS